MKAIKLVVAVMALASLCSAATADTGVWVANPEFGATNINTCYRKYSCQPASAQMYSAAQKLVATPEQTVYGTCSVAGGAIDECNVCLTNEPALTCEWHLEQR